MCCFFSGENPWNSSWSNGTTNPGLGFNFETRYLVVVSDGNPSYILPYMVHPRYEFVMRQRYVFFLLERHASKVVMAFFKHQISMVQYWKYKITSKRHHQILELPWFFTKAPPNYQHLCSAFGTFCFAVWPFPPSTCWSC